MSFALDHVFCFVDSDGRDVAEAEQAGFVNWEPRSHGDQGTSARFCIFPEHYLEWIWLRSRAEAEVHPLRLDRRADWRTTGACPFGFGFKGPVESGSRAAYRPYDRIRATSGQPPLLVHRESWAPGPLPMIFTFEGNEQFPVADMPPRRQPRFADGRHFTHPSHPNGFSSILVTVPIDVPDDFTQLAPNLDIRRGPAFALEVTLEAEPFDPVTLFGLVTIRSAGGGARSGEG